MLVGSSSLLPPDHSPLLCLRWSFKEDKMSLITSHAHSSLHGGGLANLLSMYTWWKRSPISSLQVWYPASWMEDTSTLGSSLGRPCWQPWQINLSTSFHQDSAACTNILWRMNEWCGPPTSHSGYMSRNMSASIWCSASLTDIPPFFTCSLVAKDFCHLLP